MCVIQVVQLGRVTTEGAQHSVTTEGVQHSVVKPICMAFCSAKDACHIFMRAGLPLMLYTLPLNCMHMHIAEWHAYIAQHEHHEKDKYPDLVGL